jgi:hypothetical protein
LHGRIFLLHSVSCFFRLFFWGGDSQLDEMHVESVCLALRIGFEP